MKIKLFALAAVSFLCASFARADTFVFTPTGGTPITFTTGALPDEALTFYPFDYAAYNLPNGARVYFIADDQAQDQQRNAGYGHVDFVYSPGSGPYDTLDGPTLFTGSVKNPSFIPGTYVLTGEIKEGNHVGGTLVITPNLAATPEPSSLALLGTGLVGTLGVMRRRFIA